METILKALQLLKYISEQPLSVTEAAQKLQIHKSSASRILSTMRSEGFVELNAKHKYEIGQAVYMLTNTITKSERIKRIANPYLVELNKKIDETLHLSILDGVNVVYIDKIESSKLIRLHSTIGATNPIYCTGVGKVLLAFQPETTQQSIISKIKFVQYTKNTITDAKTLQKELEEIRNQGVGFDFGEHNENVNCIAAPIFDSNSIAIASISISAPEFCTDKEALSNYKDLLLNTANKISSKISLPNQNS